MSRFSALLVGVGGQGVLSAAQIVGAAAHAAGLEVVVGQLHGMSQRGGSVRCTILLGRGESSFLTGDADAVIAFEALEALRTLENVGPKSRVLVSSSRIVPLELVRDGKEYPSNDTIAATLRETGAEVHFVDGAALVRFIGEPRTLNVLLLGAAAGLGLLPIPEQTLLDAALARCAPAFVDSNRRAFAAGRDAVRAEPTPS
jgi:indolepyruvate ferredoxin oxidoreductase beta subunit